MNDIQFLVMLCLTGFGIAAAFVIWIVTSNSRAANWAVSVVQRINEILTFGKAH